MVPLEALLGEREKWKKRVALATPPPPPAPAEEPAEEPGQPLFNWEKLVPQSSGQSPQPVGAQGPPPMDPNQFEEQFRDMINDKPWQAIMWAIQTGNQYRDRMESQAKQFVPDYGELPVHEVSDQEMQMLASNPYAMKAMIAKAKAAASGKYSRAAVGARLGGGSPPPASAPTTAASSASPVSPEAIKAAMDLITSLGKSSGVSGEGTRGPVAPPAAADAVELDKDSVAYLKARGYTDDQIKEQAKRIVDIRRRRGQVV
jgi:hypothetical protein